MADVYSYLSRGGIIMVPLLLSSVLALAIVIERAISLRRSKILVPEIISVVEEFSSNEDVKLATSLCEKNRGAFANIILTGLQNRNLSPDEVRELLIDQGRQEVRSLERGLPALETIAGIAPLLGLLGTVLGMIKVFTVISKQGTGQASLLAGGISEALITTVTGLIIGILALIMYNYFSHRAENYILDIEKYTTQLMQTIRRL
ncbi:MotA/TolQ/ExbB proton channel family protein [candidate division KSB1 bacterium]|nr:MotA/TolQ/ExbB proton channel family protein [candidate division KSB1 bacterium]RQW10720.1 MAG: MotA/TolQ/ExbB proton channel family protein [candidate division KSB1 bacterium]